MTTPAFPWETPFEDPAYPRLKEYLLRLTGLAYYADRDLELGRLLGRRLVVTGLSDCHAYLELLRDSLRGAVELDALIAELTIGETYFFRHQEHFDALREHVIPALLARNQATRSLRIWCAGCSDGCEPYSVAILLQREFADPLAGWDVRIVATDISRHSLERAREAEFPAWALRATSDSLKQQCFTRHGNLWRLEDKFKKGVTFHQHNLADEFLPSSGLTSAFDLIVCRNVMIYFGPELMRQTVSQFHKCLAPEAWLMVGPAEPNMTFFTAFRAVQLHGLTFYQKPGEGGCDNASVDLQSRAMPSAPPPPAIRPTSVPKPRPAAVTSEPENLEVRLAAARGYADAGKWELAVACCDALLETHALDSRVHLIRGLIFDQMGKLACAEQSFRRAIYLDRQSVLAHYSLGLVLQAQAESAQAVRSFENSLGLLSGLSGDYEFPDADGIRADELKESAAMHLEILREHLCNTPA